MNIQELDKIKNMLKDSKNIIDCYLTRKHISEDDRNEAEFISENILEILDIIRNEEIDKLLTYRTNKEINIPVKFNL